jgi:hypothetical protein
VTGALRGTYCSYCKSTDLVRVGPALSVNYRSANRKNTQYVSTKYTSPFRLVLSHLHFHTKISTSQYSPHPASVQPQAAWHTAHLKTAPIITTTATTPIDLTARAITQTTLLLHPKPRSTLTTTPQPIPLEQTLPTNPSHHRPRHQATHHPTYLNLPRTLLLAPLTPAPTNPPLPPIAIHKAKA